MSSDTFTSKTAILFLVTVAMSITVSKAFLPTSTITSTSTATAINNNNDNNNNNNNPLVQSIRKSMTFLSSVASSASSFGEAPSHSSETSPSIPNTENTDGMPILPSNVVQYSQVPKVPNVFTATTVPKGLLRQHSTKKGTWGIIVVRKGQLQYTIPAHNVEPTRVFVLDGSSENSSLNKGIIEPQVLHEVKPLSDDVEFVVQFWRVPGTGPVDEKRE